MRVSGKGKLQVLAFGAILVGVNPTEVALKICQSFSHLQKLLTDWTHESVYVRLPTPFTIRKLYYTCTPLSLILLRIIFSLSYLHCIIRVQVIRHVARGIKINHTYVSSTVPTISTIIIYTSWHLRRVSQKIGDKSRGYKPNASSIYICLNSEASTIKKTMQNVLLYQADDGILHEIIATWIRSIYIS